jgi:anti-anti-sigma factor
VPEPVVIAPEGELDLHFVDALTPQLDEATGADYPHLILDLSAVTLVDSTALGAIAQVQHRFHGRGRKLSVVAPPGSAAAVMLELSGLQIALLAVRLPRRGVGMSGAPRRAAGDGSGATNERQQATLSRAPATRPSRRR